MGMKFRQACSEDINAVGRVYQESLGREYRFHGFGAFMPGEDVNPFYGYAFREEPSGSYVAEDNGLVVASAISWVREHLWFLSHLFVLPDYQGQGIGTELLNLCCGYARRLKCTHRAVMTMAFNPVSLALYIKNGMYPVEDVMLLYTDAKPRMDHNPSAELSFEAIPGDDPSNLDLLASMDRKILGVRRDGHHRFFLHQPDARAFIIMSQGYPRGYMYVWADGRIGPLAASDKTVLVEAVRHAIREASSTGSRTTLMVPASNTATLKSVIEAGFSVAFMYTILCSTRLEPLEHYVIHSPGLL